MAASPSPLPALLPDASLHLDGISQQNGVIALNVSITEFSATCPACGIRSRHIHSRYCRVLQDLPWQGFIVRIRLWTRRFYCRVAGCRCRIFTQRLPSIARPHARQTSRHRDAVLAIGYALGGEAGRRLALQLGISSSADTILRTLRHHASETAAQVKVLGVDDWAWRRGHRYGTVLVDLERRQPIDLLPDREADTLADWLRAHPSVQIITRDRAGAYADGARQGAPNAIQVADRFHLFCNLTSALQRLLERLSSILPQLAAGKAARADSTIINRPDFPDGPEQTPVPGEQKKMNQHEREREQRRGGRKALYEAVHDAYHRGLTKRAIAKELGITRTTVRRFLRAREFPERAPRRQRSALDAYREYLERRWAEGCHNASQLCRELRQMGYGGQRSRVKEYVQSWRAKPKPATPRSRRVLPNLKLVAFWLAKPAAQRNPEEQRWVDAVTAAHPQVAASQELAHQFRQLFKDRDSAALRSWLARTSASGVPELKRFVAGIQRDYAAVAAAVERPWSNGQVEGQVHRLKLLKRQMYGRSGFQLLRSRVLPLAGPFP